MTTGQATRSTTSIEPMRRSFAYRSSCTVQDLEGTRGHGFSDGDTEHTRDKDGEYEDGIYARRDRRVRSTARFQIIATQCPIYRRTQEAKEKAKVKGRGLTALQLPARKCVPVAKAIFRQSCIHDQVPY
jgi:hypothetical protein